jgi:thiol-disulfide isomerase/thioredoxin
MKARLISLFLALVSLHNTAPAATPGEVDIGGTLREATLQGLSGPSQKLSHFKGTPLLINVWASWCGPCRQEMPSLERLTHRKGGRPLVVIGISTDDYPQAAKRFLAQSKTTFPHFIDQRLLLENMLGADRLPLTLLVDAKGRVLIKFYGAKEWDSPEALALIDKTFR